MPDSPTLENVRAWLEQGDEAAIRQLAEEAHPHTIAELVADLEDEQVWSLLQKMPPTEAGQVYSHLDLERQASLAEQFDDREVATLLEQVAPDDRTDVIQELDPAQQESILAEMAGPEREEIERLDQYAEHTAGSVMSTDVVSLKADLTVQGALEQLRRQAGEKETIFYNYIVDDAHRLVGIVSLKDLVISPPEAKLIDLMDTSPITISAEDDQADAARLIQQYDLLALPVVDRDNRLVGIVTVDDVLDVQQEEATEDFHKLGGVVSLTQPYLSTTIPTLVSKRVGWLAILFGAGLLTVGAMGAFEEQIEQLPLLAVFVPLIIATGGNSGFQAATIMTRAIALQEVEPRHFGRVFGREMFGGLLLGLILAVIAFIMATIVGMWIYSGDVQLLSRSANVGVAVSMSVIAVVLFGNMVGSVLPFLLLKLGLDPATGSTPFVATVVDVAGLLLYFTIATWWLSDQFRETAASVGL
ncbi:magnesium transporter [Phycisphaerales bacterium AB-hyl4]|uniref:Magnesium transporter MgtE n=1 Tax=Natronomicrosphaera hydrolytica TaxID=3242702 RepID=A0ABV4U2Y9_9BACT